MRRQILASVGILCLAIVTFYFRAVGIIKVTDISAAIAFVLIAGIVALAAYGFTDVFERLFGIKQSKTPLPVTTQSTSVPEVDLDFFRNQLFGELVSILSQLRSPILVVPTIAYSVWRNRPDYLKIQLLGADDHSVLDAFYRRVDERNSYYAHATPEALQDVAYDDSRREIIENARRLFDEIAWLRVRRDEVPWPTE
jgi:hypothetical protein